MSPKPKANQRLRLARREASKDLGLPLDHWAVKRTAILHLAHENMTAALCDGHRVDIGDLLKIEDALQSVRATLPPPKIEVGIEIVGSEWSEKEIDAEAVETKPIENTAPTATAEALKAAETAPKAKPPEEPLTRDTGVSVSGFHSQQFASGERPPLKSLQPPSRPGQQYAGLNDQSLCWTTARRRADAANPAPEDPHPYYVNGDPSRHRY